MKCPKCSAAMERVTVDGIEVDRCIACHGIWLDLGEVEKLRAKAGQVDTGESSAGKTAKAGVVNCPRCNTRMIEMVVLNHPHIRYESCKICYGVYFDAGEFREASGTALQNLLNHLGLRR